MNLELGSLNITKIIDNTAYKNHHFKFHLHLIRRHLRLFLVESNMGMRNFLNQTITIIIINI